VIRFRSRRFGPVGRFSGCRLLCPGTGVPIFALWRNGVRSI